MVVNCKSLLSPYIKREGVVQSYLNDIKKYEILTKEQEKDLLKEAQSSNIKIKQKAFDTLLKHNQRFVTSVAMKYTNGENILDLINQGNIGLIEAIKRFDVDNNKNVRLITYAVWWIQKSINEYLINYSNIIRPTNINNIRHLTKKIKNKFLSTEHRLPTLEEIRDILREEYNFNVKNLCDLESFQTLSIDANVDSDDTSETFGETDIFNHYTASNNITEDITINDNKKVVKTLLKYLNKNEKDVLTRFFGLDGNSFPKSFITIGQELGFCKERVRQIYNGAISKLNKLIKENKISNL